MKKRVLLALLVSAMTLTAMPGVTFAGSIVYKPGGKDIDDKRRQGTPPLL